MPQQSVYADNAAAYQPSDHDNELHERWQKVLEQKKDELDEILQPRKT